MTATVAGGERYRVRLWLDAGGELDGACTCPVGAEGRFCKHCVAVARFGPCLHAERGTP